MSRLRWSFLIPVLFFFTALWVIVDLFFGPWDHDGGYYALLSWFISQGMHPYVDFPTRYPPLVLILNSLIFGLNPPPLLALLAGSLLWNWGICYLTYLYCVRTTGHKLFGLACACLWNIFTIENGGNHITLELGVTFFALIGMLGGGASTTRYWFSAPLAIAAATLSKQNGIATVAEIFAANRRSGNIYYLIALVAIASTITLIAFLIVAPNLEAVSRNLFGGLVAYSTASGSNFDLSRPVTDLVRSPITGALILGFILGLPYLVRLRALNMLSALLLALGFALRYGPFLFRPYSHYILALWPLLLLVIVKIWLCERTKHSEYTLPAIGCLSLFFILTIGTSMVRGVDRWQYLSPAMTILRDVSSRVRACTPPSMPVLQLGEEPAVDLLVQRIPPYLDLTWEDPYERFELSGKAVVIVDFGFRAKEKLRSRLVAQGFSRIVDSAYPFFLPVAGYHKLIMRAELYIHGACSSAEQLPKGETL